MKILLVLILVGAMGFGLYKQLQYIKDLRAENEEYGRKVQQLEAEVEHLKKSIPASRQFTPGGTSLDSSAALLQPGQTPANSKPGSWMWEKTKMDAPHGQSHAR